MPASESFLWDRLLIPLIAGLAYLFFVPALSPFLPGWLQSLSFVWLVPVFLHGANYFLEEGSGLIGLSSYLLLMLALFGFLASVDPAIVVHPPMAFFVQALSWATLPCLLLVVGSVFRAGRLRELGDRLGSD